MVKTFLTAGALAMLVAGCDGANMGALPGAQPNASVTTSSARKPQAAHGTAVMTIRIPRPAKHPAYVSPATQSLVIYADGTKLGDFDVTPTSNGCKKFNGVTQCKFKLGVPIGQITFKVDAYSGTSGSGSLLSEGSVTQQVDIGKMVVIAVTLGGVVKSIAIVLGNPSPRAGTATTTPVYVTGYDASGAAIVGPGDFTSTITLSNSDTTHKTELSTTKVSGPSGHVTLSYDGTSLVSATIGATADGVSQVTTATFAPKPVIAESYPLPLSVEGKPYAITSAPDGDLWFTTSGGSHSNAIVKMTTSGAMTAFRGGTGGLTNDDYVGIAAGSDGNLWFTEYKSSKIGRITPDGLVKQFALPRGWCPYQIVSNPADHSLWFTSYCKNSIGQITIDGTIRTYSIARGGSKYTGIILGKDGNLYIADRGNRSIGRLKISDPKMLSYTEIPVGNNPFDGRPNDDLLSLAQTGDGTIWWTNAACTPSTIGSLTLAPTFTDSKIAQYITKVGCSDPAFLAVAPAGSQTLWLAEARNPIIEEVNAPDGGGIPTLTDFTVQAHTPSGSPQHTWGIALGPDGNVYSTVYTIPGNIVKLIY